MDATGTEVLVEGRTEAPGTDILLVEDNADSLGPKFALAKDAGQAPFTENKPGPGGKEDSLVIAFFLQMEEPRVQDSWASLPGSLKCKR